SPSSLTDNANPAPDGAYSSTWSWLDPDSQWYGAELPASRLAEDVTSSQAWSTDSPYRCFPARTALPRTVPEVHPSRAMAPGAPSAPAVLPAIQLPSTATSLTASACAPGPAAPVTVLSVTTTPELSAMSTPRATPASTLSLTRTPRQWVAWIAVPAVSVTWFPWINTSVGPASARPYALIEAEVVVPVITLSAITTRALPCGVPCCTPSASLVDSVFGAGVEWVMPPAQPTRWLPVTTRSFHLNGRTAYQVHRSKVLPTIRTPEVHTSCTVPWVPTPHGHEVVSSVPLGPKWQFSTVMSRHGVPSHGPNAGKPSFVGRSSWIASEK